MYRKIVGETGIDVGTYIGTKEEALVEEYALIPLLAVRCGAFGMEMVEVQVAHVTGIGPAAQCLYQYMRHSRHTAQMNLAV